MSNKYASLEKSLRDLPSTQKEVTLSFAQIEEILKSKLPASAYEDNRWLEHVPLCPSDISPKNQNAIFGGDPGIKNLDEYQN